MRKPLGCLVIIVACCSLVAALYIFFMQYGSVASGVVHFHEQYNESQYSMMWNDASTKLHDSFVTMERFVAYLQSNRDKFGKAVSSSKVSRQEVDRNTSPRKVEIVQKTVFEKDEITEVFTFEIVRLHVLLAGYRIERKDLNPK